MHSKKIPAKKKIVIQYDTFNWFFVCTCLIDFYIECIEFIDISNKISLLHVFFFFSHKLWANINNIRDPPNFFVLKSQKSFQFWANFDLFIFIWIISRVYH